MSGQNTNIDHEAVQRARQQSTEIVERSTQRARAVNTEAEQASAFWKGDANAAATAAAQRMHASYQKLIRAADEYHAAVGKADSTFTDTESASTQQFTKLP